MGNVFSSGLSKFEDNNNFHQNLRKLNGIFAILDRIFADHFLANESVELFQNLSVCFILLGAQMIDVSKILPLRNLQKFHFFKKNGRFSTGLLPFAIFRKIRSGKLS